MKILYLFILFFSYVPLLAQLNHYSKKQSISNTYFMNRLKQAHILEESGNFSDAIILYETLLTEPLSNSQMCTVRASLNLFYEILNDDALQENSEILNSCHTQSGKVIDSEKKATALSNDTLLYIDITSRTQRKSVTYETDGVDPMSLYVSYLELSMDYIVQNHPIEYSFSGSLSGDYQWENRNNRGYNFYAYGRYSLMYKGLEIAPSAGVDYSSDSLVYEDNWNYYFDTYIGYYLNLTKRLKLSLFGGVEYNEYNTNKAGAFYTSISYTRPTWSIRFTPGYRYDIENTYTNTLEVELETVADTILGELNNASSQQTLYATISATFLPFESLKFRLYSGIYYNQRTKTDRVTPIDVPAGYDSILSDHYTHTQGYTRTVLNGYLTYSINDHQSIQLFSKYSVFSQLPVNNMDIFTDSYESTIGSGSATITFGLEYQYSL